jgi:hypothetical protein
VIRDGIHALELLHVHVTEASHLAFSFGLLALGRYVGLGRPFTRAYIKISTREKAKQVERAITDQTEHGSRRRECL